MFSVELLDLIIIVGPFQMNESSLTMLLACLISTTKNRINLLVMFFTLFLFFLSKNIHKSVTAFSLHFQGFLASIDEKKTFSMLFSTSVVSYHLHVVDTSTLSLCACWHKQATHLFR